MLRLIRKNRFEPEIPDSPAEDYVIDLELLEAHCEFCGEVCFVNNEMFAEIQDKLRLYGQNPFYCESCRQEFASSAK